MPRSERSKQSPAGRASLRPQRDWPPLWPGVVVALAVLAVAFEQIRDTARGSALTRDGRSGQAAGRKLPKGSESIPPGRARREDKDRGRSAATPSEIPPRGWKDILLRVYTNISEHRVLAIAAATAIFRFHAGMLTVLGGSCVAGILLRLLGAI